MLDARRTGLAEGAATLLSSHAEHPRPATSDTTKGSQAHRPTASKRVSSPPVGTLSSASDDTPTTEIETASLEATAVLWMRRSSRRSRDSSDTGTAVLRRGSCRGSAARLDGDDEFASRAPVEQVADSRSDLAERIGAVDGRCELARVDELSERDQVLGVLRGHECAELLADERGEQERADLTVDAAEPASIGLAADDDEPPPASEGAPEVWEPTVAADVENDVVAVLAGCEVVGGVVDEVIGAEGADRVELRGAAHAGDLGSERLGDLDGESSHAARRADDQDLLPGLDPSVVANRLEGGKCGDGNRSRLLERQLRWLVRELVRSGACVLRERRLANAEHGVARRESGHAGADRLDRPREVAARVAVLRPAKAESRQADGIGQAGHHVPRASVNTGRMHPHENLVLSDHGPVDILDPQDVLGRGAVLVLDDRRHRLPTGGHPRRFHRCGRAGALVIGILHDHGDDYECALDLILDRLATAWDRRASR